MKRFILLLFAAAMALSLGGCAETAETKYFYAMDTLMELQLYGDDGTVAALCEERVRELEGKMSVTLEESEIATLNREGRAKVSEDTLAVLQAGLKVSRVSDGAFCLSLYPASRLWGFTEEEQRVPKREELNTAAALIDDGQITLNDGEVSIKPGMALDLGGVAKGYAADCLDALLEESGIDHAFLSLGGNVWVRGGKPDGSAWRVGIADPMGGEYIGIVELTEGSVVTSGGYQRNFTHEGETYHHILDPQTLYPAKSGLKSATVVAKESAYADGLSTALFVLGEEQALALQKARGDFECILITEDSRVVVSDGLKERFTLHNTAYDYEA